MNKFGPENSTYYGPVYEGLSPVEIFALSKSAIERLKPAFTLDPASTNDSNPWEEFANYEFNDDDEPTDEASVDEEGTLFSNPWDYEDEDATEADFDDEDDSDSSVRWNLVGSDLTPDDENSEDARDSNKLRKLKALSENLYEVLIPPSLVQKTSATSMRVLILPRDEAIRKVALDHFFRRLGYENFMREVCQLITIQGQNEKLGVMIENARWTYLFGEDFHFRDELPQEFVDTSNYTDLNRELNESAELLIKKLKRDGISLSPDFIRVGARFNQLYNFWEKRLFIDSTQTEGRIDLSRLGRNSNGPSRGIEPISQFWDLIDAAAPQ